MNTFSIKTEKFEGPIDLLLSLIERRKLNINDVSLATVADSFIDQVRGLGTLPVAETANFLLVASTLLLLKSLSLIPNLEITSEEQANIRDLELRLQIFRLIKEVGQKIRDRFGRHIIFWREPSTRVIGIFAPSEDASITSLHTAMRSVIANFPQEEKLPKGVVKKMISLEDVIKDLLGRIEHSFKMSFNEFAGAGKGEKAGVIVSFLAVLELVRQGLVKSDQQESFSDISVEKI